MLRFRDFFKRRKNSKKGFTVVEMVATVCVISIISAVTVQIVFSVQSTVRNSGEITTNQYKTTQVEKFIRNEFQVSTAVNWVDSGVPTGGTGTREDDEIMYYDSTAKTVVFKKTTADDGTYEDYLKVESVDSVTIKIYPMNATNPESPYKLVYEIDAGAYQYKGGVVLSNTKANDTDPDTGCFFSRSTNSIELEWGFNDDGSERADNNKVITFHSETATEVSSGTSST